VRLIISEVGGNIMNTSKAIVWLSALIAVLALVAVGIGLFYQNGGSSFSFTTLHG
jgi:hypothetical protein